jgi:hypothetical protein
MFLFKRKKKVEEQAVDPNARSEQLGIKYKDLAVLGQLMNQGADLSKPRHALYYLYFKSKDAAESSGIEASAAGYSYEVRDPLPQYPGQWSLVCERPDAVLDPPGVIAADNLFQGIADRYGGEYDGWEAAAQP